MDTLPRPTLWAVPSAVVSRGADVTLRCQGQPGREMFQLWQDGELREERNASGHLAEFSLWNVEGLRDARSYSCRYGQGALWSELSEPLAVVVTGEGCHPGGGADLREQPPSLSGDCHVQTQRLFPTW
ncbi:natural cytotoxicity triggering receptor 1-like [Monodelphis domestica]|uniref:natural cytotoxicity triggering receptor 1-like n=1 Tax=Monodelphis domestica TaxID=13616 RepID=UPI0024E1EBB5|nr:natural cytotoxicity triggering receptor 1-like [Monodelphis domestica]